MYSTAPAVWATERWKKVMCLCQVKRIDFEFFFDMAGFGFFENSMTFGIVLYFFEILT